MKTLILSLLFFTVAGAGQAQAWTVSVKADKFSYEIDYTKKNFSYKDAYIKKEWPVKACNKKVFDKVQRDFQTAYKKRAELKGKFPNKIIYQEDRKSHQIAQSSPFGVYLTQFPNRVISLMTEEEHACKHKK